jgi:PAS domain S-box-containing protein
MMKEEEKKEQLISELAEMRQRVAELEASETERRQGEESSREVRSFYEALVGEAGDAIIALSRDGKIISWNQGAERLFGWAAHEAIGLSWLEVQETKASEQIKETIEKVFAGETISSVDMRRYTKDGAQVDVLLTASPIRDATGEVISALGIVKDVTERKRTEEELRKLKETLEKEVEIRTADLMAANDQLRSVIIQRKRAEEALRESEELHRITLSHMSDAVFITDDSGAFVYVCPNVDVIFGYSCSESQELGNIARLLGNGFFDRSELERSGEIQNIEMDVTDKFKKGHSLLVNVKSVSIKGGTLLYTCRDITKRKQAEEELRKQSYELGERVKELNCLYAISSLVEKQDISLEEILHGTVEIIPPSWQYPEITCARITLGDRAFQTGNFEETIWKQACDFVVHGKRTGSIEVCYLEEKPEFDEGPFLKEERSLLKAIAERLGRIVERKQVEEALRTCREFNEYVIQSIQDGLATLDRDLRITLWNKAMERISGYAAQEVLWKNAFEVFPHLVEEGTVELLKTALEGQASGRSNVSYRTPKGKSGFTNEKYLPFWNPQDEVVGVLAIVEDVTEALHWAQESARLEEELEQRKVVEIAKGILMRELGLQEDESFQFIRKKSQDESKKMVDVAKQVIEFFGSSEERNKLP